MDASLAAWEGPLARLQRDRATAPDLQPGPEIVESWARCLATGLDESQALRVPVLEAAELDRRRERNDELRRLAGVELGTLAQQIAGSNHLLAFADSEGVILDVYQDHRFEMSHEGAAIVPGGCWSETVAGTNGLGTALRAGRPVAVTGPQHYLLGLGGIACTAAPVHDAWGAVVGVIDASSHVLSRQRHTLALVQMAAIHLEGRLLRQQLRGHWVLALHPRSEYLGTVSAGLVAFAPDGCLAAINPRAQQMLQGLPAELGMPFEALFDETFELALARVVRQGETRLRDRLGSGLAAQCLQRPAEAAVAVRPGSLPLRRERAADAEAARRPPQERSRPGREDVHASVPEPVGARCPAGDDEAVVAAYGLAARAARRGWPLLLQGETGTGKEMLARHVHAASGRGGAFVPVNCGAIPSELFEAELFGYASGAFTGARREGHAGLIAAAEGGTLLLDEVGELPLSVQATLLRFLDDHELRPVGHTQGRRVDVLVVAATHVDLERAVADKRFRADLLYRLNTVQVMLPPLRARSDAADRIRAQLRELDPEARLSAQAMQGLLQHPWPGNFRELRAVLARALLLADGPDLDHQAFGPELRSRHGPGHGQAPAPDPAPTVGGAEPLLRGLTTALVRREHARLGGNVSETARVLGVSRTTVYRHLQGS